MKGKGKGQYFLLIFLILISMLATGCGKEKELVKESALTVNTAPAVERDIAKSMRYSGMVRGHNEVYIMPKMPARVTAIHVQPGQRVRAGQLLLSLDSKDLNVAVKQAEAALAGARAAQVANELSLENARKNFERNEELHKAGAISDSQFEAEKLRYESLNSGAVAASVAQAEAALASLQNQMENCNLTSPIEGIVGSINLSLGETANPQMPAAIVTDTGELEIELLVSEAEVSYIKVGSAVDVAIEAAGEKPFAGRVKSVSVVPDPVKRSYAVKVSLPNPEGLIKSGMFAEARVDTQSKKDVLAIPVNAVVPKSGRQVVYVLEMKDKENRAREVEVETGIKNENYIEISKGLKPGQEIITRGNTLVSDGTLVRVVAGGSK